jgi:hypothetical protein
MTTTRGRSLSEHGSKERQAIDAWARRLGASFVQMSKHLESYRLPELVKEARLLASIRPTSKFGRMCLRHKRAAVCWLAENDPDLLTRTRLRIGRRRDAPGRSVERRRRRRDV